MSIIDNEDIIAFVIHDLIYCLDCAEKQKKHERHPVTAESIEDEHTVTCDGCNAVILEN